METTVRNIAIHLSWVVELLGAVVIAVGLVQFLAGYLPAVLKRRSHLDNAVFRVRFGSTLTIALELLLAADILETAVAPTWDDIGKLAAIAAIRTTLNFFLEKELKEMEKRQAPGVEQQ
ncbi:Uncharacterized membrane protein [Cnuella takakiae]|uniref:Uncharacterized membrane protein n=1 Tax=Cnuella takakiae TaxID=1302690 RepID=A0A1M5A1J9_9BACT|nr:DUF1622 domain-containing protein [Cnuella takakiae]OLY92126.1 hypothetical protein BUE76_09625 [Cnuella takakiae]SHF24230.1 Uncharacterized membrane protein [Cnuella takakiae]